MQGWLFQDKQFWQQAQIKAMLTSVPEVSCYTNMAASFN